jgi:2-methylcitrate dehydratase PrpD
MKQMASAVRDLAEWSAGLTISVIPADVLAVGRRCLIDTIGVALAGSSTRVARMARSLAGPGGPGGPASLIGCDRKASGQAAAFANGTAAHALDFDDNCYAGVVHGSAVIVPAVLAAVQAEALSGEAVLVGLIAGSEVEYAVGAAAGLSLYQRGWWTTGLLGPVGAAAATAHALRLDPRRTADAIAIAASGAGGAKACFGTDAKALLSGRAAEAGHVCAWLAREGATGPHDILEHPHGLVGLTNGGAFDDAEIATIGRTWRMLTPGVDVKRIPVCLSAHAAVDAAAELTADLAEGPRTLRRIVCDVPPIVRANLLYDRPRTPQEAQFSLPFAIAAHLHFGTVTLAHLKAEVLAIPELRDLMAKVEVITGPRWDDPRSQAAAPEGAEVTIETAEGDRRSRFRAFARGTARDPLAPDEVEGKFMACATRVLDDIAAETLLGRLRLIEQWRDTRSLFACDR